MAASRATGLPSKIIATQIDYESGWRTNVTSPAGAQGIAQFEPGTWKQWGHGSPFNARDSFTAYAKFMRSLVHQEHGSIRNALAAYNAGPGNLNAGYPYADTILGAAGYGQGVESVPYKNPLRNVQGLTAGRIDMGVDYGGTGPIYALGPGTITNLYNSGWPGGAFIGERLSSGPLAGHYVYAAEDITPTARIGQHVTADTQIGLLTGGGIETGFAAPPGTGNALGASQFTGSNATAYGKAYSDILHELGAPAGTTSGSVTGQLPSWLHWIGTVPIIGFGGGGSGGGGGIIGGVEQGISDIGNFFKSIASAVDWLVNPGHWVRIVAFFGGATFLVMGVWSLTHVGGDLPGAGPITRPAALPIGVALVGSGGILLFVAFHNLDAQGVTDIKSLLGYFRTELKGGSSLGNAP